MLPASRFRRNRVCLDQWIAQFARPSPELKPYPGWRLGAGERRSGRLSTQLRRKIWSAISTPVETPWIEGLNVYAYPGNEISRALFVTGYYEPNEFYFLSKILKAGMSFVDVGSNMGLYSIYAARKVGEAGTVVAIEPSTRESDRLLENLVANSISNVSLLRYAASDSNSKLELLIADDERSGHNTLGAFAYDTALALKETVQAERLDEILSKVKLPRVDAIKMDIEGAEFHALCGAEGMIERFQPVLLLEISDRALRHQGSGSAQIWTFLQKREYTIFSFHERTGMLQPAQRKQYYDSENVVAVPKSYELPTACINTP